LGGAHRYVNDEGNYDDRKAVMVVRHLMTMTTAGKLTLKSPVFTAHTIRLNVSQFYLLPTQCISVLYGSHNKQ